MSRVLPLHTCANCGKTTFCYCCGDHYECQECFTEGSQRLKERFPRVEDYCMTGGIHRKGYLEWVKKYKNSRIKV